MCRYSSHPQINPLDPLGSGNYCQHLCSPLQEASQKCWLPPTPLLTFFRELESPIWFGFTFQIYPSIWLVLTISTPASWGFCLNYCHSLLTGLHASNLTPCCLSQGSNQHDLCNMEVRLQHSLAQKFAMDRPTFLSLLGWLTRPCRNPQHRTTVPPSLTSSPFTLYSSSVAIFVVIPECLHLGALAYISLLGS